MSFNIVVLAKQVPDTRNVGKDAMTPQGTVNRAALPAIFNPEDLNALGNPMVTIWIFVPGCASLMRRASSKAFKSRL